MRIVQKLPKPMALEEIGNADHHQMGASQVYVLLAYVEQEYERRTQHVPGRGGQARRTGSSPLPKTHLCSYLGPYGLYISRQASLLPG